ncbi:C10 family peptidase [Planctomycetota bacterium]
MVRRNIILTAVLIVLHLCSFLLAAPTTPYEAEMVVTGWLKADPQPLGMALGRQVMKVETFSGEDGEPFYYIVYLQFSGFVIVPADDLIEPIIGFVKGSFYDPSIENPLGALVTNDLKGRIADAPNHINPLATTPKTVVTRIQKKWTYYISLGETSNDGFEPLGAGPNRDGYPSDVRIAPLVKTQWYQGNIYEKYYDNVEQRYKLRNLGIACQNYYTPRLVDNRSAWDEDDAYNFVCGCVATAMAQLMRYHTYPYQPNQPDDPFEVKVGVKDNYDDFNDVDTIYPNGTLPKRSLLGGDTQGGAYQWNDMELVPEEIRRKGSGKPSGRFVMMLVLLST